MFLKSIENDNNLNKLWLVGILLTGITQQLEQYTQATIRAMQTKSSILVLAY